MPHNVFISFRYADGIGYKNALAQLLNRNENIIDFSEDQDRSKMIDATIRQYLYAKLRRASVTIVILTPLALNHRKNYLGQYDDWMYDEIRYSLEDREDNRTNGIIAVYTPEAAEYFIRRDSFTGAIILDPIDNLAYYNMMNVLPLYKCCPTVGSYDLDYDNYCSFISWDDFTAKVDRHIDIAYAKRGITERYNIVRRLQ